MKLKARSFVAATIAALVSTTIASAHCDTLAGPVVAAARTALASADVSPALKWVRPDDEPTIRAAFATATIVRQQSKEAAQLADLWFFETLVRTHRAGEGEPFLGLKPASAVAPSARAADAALDTASIASLADVVADSVRLKLTNKFERAMRLRAHANDSVAAGREYVAAYIDYMHFAERVLELGEDAETSAHGH